MKLYLMLFALVAMLGFAACSSDSDSSSSPDSTNDAVPEIKMSCGENSCIQ